ncbi:MAG: electron transfer flavoprotein subunit alpha [Actinobacteria bacterium]|nr:electron transfer flavoprotein subunit alpha [Actinomycetota bacterium]MCG2801240.1 hypothetical protein [Cellulomonas sp.]
MTTAAAYTWSRDPGSAHVSADGTVTWPAAKLTPGEDDHAALAVAVAIGGSEGVVGVTLGAGDASWALARKATRAIVVSDAPLGDDDAATGAVLAAAARRAGADDVVVVGDSEAHPGVAPAVAGHLGWPIMLGVTSAQRIDGRVHVTRQVAGVEETVAITPPVVLGVTAVSVERSAPGMKEMLAARKRPVEKVTVAELGLEQRAALHPTTTRCPEATRARIFDGDPDRAAADLVAFLRSEGVA